MTGAFGAAAEASCTVNLQNASKPVTVSTSCQDLLTSLARAASAPAAAASAAASASPHEALADDIARKEHELHYMLRIAGGMVSLILFCIAWRFAHLARLKADTDGGIRYTNHWGGFGGSTTGWKLSSGAVSLMLAATLAALAAGLMMEVMRPTSAELLALEKAK